MARGGEWRVDTGRPNQQSAAKQHSPSVVAQMISLSHAASLVQERAPCCPQSPLVLTIEPWSGSWLWFQHQLQRLASGVRGKLKSWRTGLLATSRPHLRLRLAVKWSEHRHRLRQRSGSGVSAAVANQKRPLY
ncbi:hypothetical protein NDU88_000212 [Pleurodeles waltl]|uniref:Uncharacterized protein n=1 Tax=Pleurodeles waltl TaxID=8319 RepID=A0AAV7UPC3_PLEWA|nr:hypothetical protein NDU88_000212 [Pleurodeles waltl]